MRYCRGMLHHTTCCGLVAFFAGVGPGCFLLSLFVGLSWGTFQHVHGVQGKCQLDSTAMLSWFAFCNVTFCTVMFVLLQWQW